MYPPALLLSLPTKVQNKNSPNDMETINIWAEMSSAATNAREKHAPDTHVRNAIRSTDIAKIHRVAKKTKSNVRTGNSSCFLPRYLWVGGSPFRSSVRLVFCCKGVYFLKRKQVLKRYILKKETVVETEPRQPNNAVSSGSSLSKDEQSGTSSNDPYGKPTVSEKIFERRF